MHIAMLGYDYGLMPAYAGPQGYVRSGSYLGADATTTPVWWNEAKGLAQQGLDTLKTYLQTKIAASEAAGKTADAKTAENLLATVEAGKNPFASSSEYLPWVVGGLAAIVVVALVMKKRR